MPKRKTKKATGRPRKQLQFRSQGVGASSKVDVKSIRARIEADGAREAALDSGPIWGSTSSSTPGRSEKSVNWSFTECTVVLNFRKCAGEEQEGWKVEGGEHVYYDNTFIKEEKDSSRDNDSNGNGPGGDNVSLSPSEIKFEGDPRIGPEYGDYVLPDPLVLNGEGNTEAATASKNEDEISTSISEGFLAEQEEIFDNISLDMNYTDEEAESSLELEKVFAMERDMEGEEKEETGNPVNLLEFLPPPPFPLSPEQSSDIIIEEEHLLVLLDPPSPFRDFKEEPPSTEEEDIKEESAIVDGGEPSGETGDHDNDSSGALREDTDPLGVGVRGSGSGSDDPSVWSNWRTATEEVMEDGTLSFYFACRHCGKKFDMQWKLLEHEEVHDPLKRPYKCEKCGKMYKWACDAKRHIRKKHGRKWKFIDLGPEYSPSQPGDSHEESKSNGNVPSSELEQEVNFESGPLQEEEATSSSQIELNSNFDEGNTNAIVQKVIDGLIGQLESGEKEGDD